MKKILVALLLAISLLSCSKGEDLSIVTYKVGIFHDTRINQKNLALEFTSPHGKIESVHFSSYWEFSVDGHPITLSLSDIDFKWQIEGNKLKGICRSVLGELLAHPDMQHKRTSINGYAIVSGKRIRIYP